MRDADKVIRIHPLACSLINDDFDGDQAAVFLPITETGQREAGEKLSIAGYLGRDPALLRTQVWRVKLEAMWGLAQLSLTGEGKKEIDKLAGTEVALAGGMVTNETLAAALDDIVRTAGVTVALERCDNLLRRGQSIGHFDQSVSGRQPRTPLDADGGRRGRLGCLCRGNHGAVGEV